MNPGRASCAGLSFGQLGESANLDVADSMGAMRLAAQVRLESSPCGFVANSVGLNDKGPKRAPCRLVPEEEVVNPGRAARGLGVRRLKRCELHGCAATSETREQGP